MRLVADSGQVLDASFSVANDPLSIVYESAGGRIGINARNRDYGVGLPLLLGRMRARGVGIKEIRVDSVVTRRLPLQQQKVQLKRYAFPLNLAGVDVNDLKRDISTAAREPAARAGASTGGSSRRLRFMIDAADSAEDLELILAGSGIVPDVDAVQEVAEWAAGKSTPGSGGGYLLSGPLRRVIEDHAMGLAVSHYSQGWAVTDVHANHSYDLECRRGDEVLYVEVKGTMSLGEAVIVTANEVEHARGFHPQTELFVVSQIAVQDGAGPNPKALGGVTRRYPAWGTVEDQLRPIAFRYRL